MPLFISIFGSNFEPYYSKLDAEKRYSEVTEVAKTRKTGAGDFKGALSAVETGKVISPQLAAYQAVEKRRRTETRHAFLARHVMTSDPITVGPGQSLDEIQHILMDKHFRHLPVMDASRALIGMVSDRDILKVSALPEKGRKRLKVRDLMTPKTYAASTDTTIYEVAKLMLNENISALPILDEDQDLVGILTTSDILKGLIRRVPIELWV